MACALRAGRFHTNEGRTALLYRCFMAFSFVPGHIFDTVFDIKPAFLRRLGIKGVICDIDNTLSPETVPAPDTRTLKWFDQLKTAGVRVALVSNNDRERVEIFNEKMRFFTVHKARKPTRSSFLLAARSMGLRPREVAVIGDQIFTDVLGGNRCGMTTILVRPIEPKERLQFRIKRRMERPFINAYHRRVRRAER